jgi:hypothetical protein
MKLLKTLIILSIALSSITSIRFTVFGDPGQFDLLFPLAVPSSIKPGVKIPATSTPLTTKCHIKGQNFNKMSNWEGVLSAFHNQLEKADTSVILGDMVYSESKYASGQYSKGYWTPLETGEDAEQYWRERLRCAWDGFFTVTKKHLLRNHHKFVNGNKFSTKFQVIPGNHLYDINPQDEVSYMNKLTNENDDFTWYPAGSDWLNGVRLQRIEEKHQIVYFLDFNSAVFDGVSSKNGTIYDGSSDDILDQIQKNLKAGFWNLDGVTNDDIFSTLEGLFEALAAIENDTPDKATIRVIRAHHPPFTVTGDSTGMFQYKSKLNGLTFLEACKKSKVNVYFASHFHSGQIWAIDYSKVSSLTGKGVRTPQENFSKDPKKNYECFPLDCSAYSLSTGIDLQNQKYLYVVLIGNSGRYFEPVNPDNNSYGTLLFARSRNNGADKSVADRWHSNQSGNYYGGAYANFDTNENKKTTIKIKIYENNAGQAEKVANLELITGTSQDINGFQGHNPYKRLK